MNQVIKEDQELAELSLGGIGRGLEKVGSGLAKGAGYVAGIPGGLSQAFQKGKARAVAGLSGDIPPEPAKQVNPVYARELERLTGKPAQGLDQPDQQEVKKAEQEMRDLYTKFMQARDKYYNLVGTPAASGGAPAGPAQDATVRELEPTDLARMAGVQPSAPAEPGGRTEPPLGDTDAGKTPASAETPKEPEKTPETPPVASTPQASATPTPPAASVTPSEVPQSAETARLQKLAGQTPKETPTVDTTKMASAPSAPKVPDTLSAQAKSPAPSPAAPKFPGGPQQGYGSVTMNVPPAVPKVTTKPTATAPAPSPAAPAAPKPSLPGAQAGAFWGKRLNEVDEIADFLQKLSAIKSKM